jgi:hypothetical protein
VQAALGAESCHCGEGAVGDSRIEAVDACAIGYQDYQRHRETLRATPPSELFFGTSATTRALAYGRSGDRASTTGMEKSST